MDQRPYSEAPTTAGDYHLDKISPCIDAGTSTGAPPDDIDGESRPYGPGYDIGADEDPPAMDESHNAIPGDLDEDGDVDYDDYLVFRTTYGSCSNDANFIQQADFDEDGCVTINDYRIFRTFM